MITKGYNFDEYVWILSFGRWFELYFREKSFVYLKIIFHFRKESFFQINLDFRGDLYLQLYWDFYHNYSWLPFYSID